MTRPICHKVQLLLSAGGAGGVGGRGWGWGWGEVEVGSTGGGVNQDSAGARWRELGRLMRKPGRADVATGSHKRRNGKAGGSGEKEQTPYQHQMLDNVRNSPHWHTLEKVNANTLPPFAPPHLLSL